MNYKLLSEMRFWYKEHGRWMKETIQETNDICITHIIWLVLMMKNLNMQSASVQCELRLVFCFFLSWGWALIWSFCFCSTLIHVCVCVVYFCVHHSKSKHTIPFRYWRGVNVWPQIKLLHIYTQSQQNCGFFVVVRSNDSSANSNMF